MPPRMFHGVSPLAAVFAFETAKPPSRSRRFLTCWAHSRLGREWYTGTRGRCVFWGRPVLAARVVAAERRGVELPRNRENPPT